MSHFNKATQAFPHSALKKVFDNIWFVRGGWDMPVPLKPRISRSMVVIRDGEDGSLTLVNSMKLSQQGLSELDALGSVKQVIRLASMHGADDAFYKERYGAKVYALRGTEYTSGLTVDADPEKSYFKPDVYFDKNTGVPLADSSVYVLHSARLKEASILLNRDGGILLSGDYFHNTPCPDEFTNLLAKIGMRLFGLAKACNIGVGWWMMTQPDGKEMRALLDIPFEHVLPIHGEPVIGNARQRFRPAVEKYAAKAEAASSKHAQSQQHN